MVSQLKTVAKATVNHFTIHRKKDCNGNAELREAVESHNPQCLEGIWPIERDGIRWMYYKDNNGNVELREAVESHNPQCLEGIWPIERWNQMNVLQGQ